MAFHRQLFFEDLAHHLRRRAPAVRSLAVMAAFERWVQMEAACMLDLDRERYGLGGGLANRPDWWITCEHRTVDIWAGENDRGGGIAIELKSLHNNKNFYSQISSLRSDLTPANKPLVWANPVERVGICVVTYARYGVDSAYVHLNASRREGIMSRDRFLHELRGALNDEHTWYAGAVPLVLVGDLQEIVSLEDAHYIEPGNGSAVWIGLVEAAA